MSPHDLLSMYSTKAVEYLIGLAFLVAFVPFWRYAMGEAGPARDVAFSDAMAALTSWFNVPDSTFFHPGHAWARVEADGLVTVGVDDFAQKLVGPLQTVALPSAGARLVQGEQAWTVSVDSQQLPMLAPLGGVVEAVNADALRDPTVINTDPYGRGWLMKLRPVMLAPQLATLRTGEAARRWMDEVCEGLSTTLAPALGPVYQDGGLPVDGLAKAACGADWAKVARRILLTSDEPGTR